MVPTETEREQTILQKRLAKLERRGKRDKVPDVLSIRQRLDELHVAGPESSVPRDGVLDTDKSSKQVREQQMQEVQRETEDDKVPGVVEGSTVAS